MILRAATSNCADSNWLAALYFVPDEHDEEGQEREALVRRFERKHGAALLISHVTWLECRNVFRRLAQEDSPTALRALEADFGRRVFVDPMNWDLLRRDCEGLFQRYAAKLELGTFDCAIVASAKLAGARRFLSFDQKAKALAVAEDFEVYPPLNAVGREWLARLRG